MQFTRREYFALIGGLGSALFLAACGKSASPTITATTSPDPEPSGSGSSPAPSGTASAPPPSAQGSSLSAVPAESQTSTAQLMSAKTAQRQAALGNGHWQGAWHDDAGRSGTSDILVAINASRGTAVGTVKFGGPVLLGSTVPDTVYEIYGLLSFVLGGTAYDVRSPQFGAVHIEGAGEHSVTATIRDVPGHPEVSSIKVNVSTLGKRSDLSYTILRTSGKTVRGTMAWSSAGVRAVPASLASSAGPTPADVQSGAYAASLLTAAQLSTATGTSYAAPQANGGRLYYTPTINVSNASAKSTSGRYSLEYSVYLGTPAAISTFWKSELGPYPLIRGPWSGAFIWPNVETFYGYVPRAAFTINVVDLKATSAPDAATVSTMKSQVTAVARLLVTALKG